MFCWGADLTTEKRRQAAALPKCLHRAAAGGADYRENCGLEFAMPEIKKAAEKPPQPNKFRTLTQKVKYQM